MLKGDGGWTEREWEMRNEEQLLQLVVKFGKCLTLIFMCELDLLIK